MRMLIIRHCIEWRINKTQEKVNVDFAKTNMLLSILKEMCAGLLKNKKVSKRYYQINTAEYCKNWFEPVN